ncbi:hypothetical protein [Arthrobacter sp. MDT1-65]
MSELEIEASLIHLVRKAGGIIKIQRDDLLNVIVDESLQLEMMLDDFGALILTLERNPLV